MSVILGTNSPFIPALRDWLDDRFEGGVEQLNRLSGNRICEIYQVTLADNRDVLVKYAGEHWSGAIAGEGGDGVSPFLSEADGLIALAQRSPGTLPAVLAVAEFGMAIEWFSSRAKNDLFWTDLAAKLARLHQQTESRFGFTSDNYCGASLQPNPLLADGYDFFAEHRLLYQTRKAYDNDLLDKSTVSDVESLCVRLPKLIPDQPAVLIHGDLWSGNCLNTSDGAKIIDPACYYGWAEADLAMTALFGGFDEAFYHQYSCQVLLEPGWRGRFELYNLYHLLNHLNLFGSGYLGAVKSALKRYQ